VHIVIGLKPLGRKFGNFLFEPSGNWLGLLQEERPMETFRELWDRALRPASGFRARAARRPGLRAAVKGLLLARTAPALAALVLGYLAFAQGYGRITRMEGPVWDRLWSQLPDQVNPDDLRAALHALPPLPGLGHVLPWLVLLAPLGVLSLWLHDAVWDHLALWMLRGLGGRKSFRVTLEADAETLKVGVIGALAGLLKYLPGVGFALGLALLPVAVYFWILRGYGMAAWHGCPVWKGVVATLLHAALMGILVFGSLGMLAVLVLQELRVG
jgi:hypothetical protein